MVKEKGKRKLRKVVTGDPDKRLRDHMREVPQVHIFSTLGLRRRAKHSIISTSVEQLVNCP